MTLSSDDQALKRAQRQLTAAAGGQDKAAGFTRVGQARLSAYGSINHPADHMPVDVADDLEEVTVGEPGWPHVTREMARRRGFCLIPLPGARPDGRSLADHLTTTHKETSDVVNELLKALEGGVDSQERDVVKAEIWQAIQALVNLDAALAEREGDTS